jgi:hypothetical protein
VYCYWDSTRELHSSITVAKVVESLVRLGVSPKIFDDKDFKEILWNNFDSTMASNSRIVNIYSLLIIINYVCQKITLSSIQMLGLGDSLHTRVTIFMMNLASRMFESTIQTFHSLDSSLYSSVPDSKNAIQGRTMSLTVDSLLWLFRQSGITQFDRVTIPWLVDEICNYDVYYVNSNTGNGGGSSARQQGPSTAYIQIPQLPSLLCRIVEDATKISCADIVVMTGIDDIGRAALYLAMACPAILFASPLRIPSPLLSMYSLANIKRIRSLLESRRLFQVYWACAAIAQRQHQNPSQAHASSGGSVTSMGSTSSKQLYNAQHHHHDTNTPTAVTAESFCVLCEEKNLVPATMSLHLVKTTCEYVLGSSDPEQHVCIGDFFELVYVLAQIVFDNMRVVANSNGDVEVIADPSGQDSEDREQAVLKADLLLECLIAVNSDEVTRTHSQGQVHVDEPGPSSPANDKNVGVAQSDAKNRQQLQSRQPAGENAATDWEEDMSKGYIRDVLILLMNFPLNSFELNPWEIFQLLLVKSSPRQRATVHPATILDADSGDCLSGVFEEFCQVYQVSTQKLSSFFASYYTEPAGRGKAAGEYVMKQDVQRCLRDPSYIVCLLQDDVLRLLYANADLLRWEFGRLCMKKRASDPFTASLDVPFPTCEFMRNRPEDAMVRGCVLLDWARQAHAWMNSADANHIPEGDDANANGPKWNWKGLPDTVAATVARTILGETALLGSVGAGHSSDENPDFSSALFNFSSFVQYIARVWTINFFREIDEFVGSSAHAVQSVSGHSTNKMLVTLLNDSKSAEGVAAYSSSLRIMLQYLSQKLARVQQHLKIRLLVPMVGIDSSYAHSAIAKNSSGTGVIDVSASTMLDVGYDNIIDATYLLNTLLAVYNERYHPSRQTGMPFEHSASCLYLPPRPPQKLWDAPRMAEYLKMIGVAQFLGSSLCGWLGFGDLYHRSQAETQQANHTAATTESNGVQPFPIKLQAAHVLFDVIQCACERLASSCSASSMSYIHGMSAMEFTVTQVVIPLAVGITDRTLIPDEPSGAGGSTGPAVSATKTLEDIFRYGGDRLMATLQLNSSFVDTIYSQLCIAHANVASNASDIASTTSNYAPFSGEELPLPAACRYLSCNGLLRSGQIALQAKRSLHPRLRPLERPSTTGNCTLTISRMEFEELLLRCALCAWEQTGATKFEVGGKTAVETIVNVEAFLSGVVQSNVTTGVEPTVLSSIVAKLSAAGGGADNMCHDSLLLSKIDPLTGFVILPGTDHDDDRSFASSPGGHHLSPDGTVQRAFKTAERYAKEVISALKAGPSWGDNTSSVPRAVSFWGVDFLAPFITILKEVVRMPNPDGSNNSVAAPMNVRSSGASLVSDNNTAVDASFELPNSAALLSSVNPTPGSTQMTMQAQYPYWPSLGRAYGTHIRVLPKVQTNESQGSAEEKSTLAAVPAPESASGINIYVQRPPAIPLLSGVAGAAAATGPVAATTAEDEALMMEVYDHLVVDPELPAIDPAQLGSPYFYSPNRYNNDMLQANRDGGRYLESDMTTPSKRGHGHGHNHHRQRTPPQTQLSSLGPSPDSHSQSRRPGQHNSRAQNRHYQSPSGDDVMPIAALLDGTTEALWPIYATYCSCGDSNDPGKLSGPNLFSLLSKLGILTDNTLLSDIGVLIHQISAHAHTQNPLDAANLYVDNIFESPSLSFEEFLVFLCAFAQLRFDGVVAAVPLPYIANHEKLQKNSASVLTGSHHRVMTRSVDNSSSRRSAASQQWFGQWEEHMKNSGSFRHLLQDFVLPILSKHPLLAFPEDARHRDRYGIIFSLEVLLAVEGAEQTLKHVFMRHIGSANSTLKKRSASHHKHHIQNEVDVIEFIIINALRRINLLPQVITEQQVRQLVTDVLPAVTYDSSSGTTQAHGPTAGAGSGRKQAQQRHQSEQIVLLFPQWEWILCVVAYEAVDIAVRESRVHTNPEVSYSFLLYML